MPEIANTFGLLLLAIVPGYLTVVSWSRARTWRGFPGDLQSVLQGLAISAVIQLILAPVTLWQLYPVRDVVPYVLGTGVAKLENIVFPAGAGEPAGLRAIVAWFVRPDPEPTIWDWAIPADLLGGRFVIIEFADGSQIAGTWGRGGVATTSPHQQGIYLNEEWLLDEAGNIYAKVPGTRGVLIPDIRGARAVRILGGVDGAE